MSRYQRQFGGAGKGGSRGTRAPVLLTEEQQRAAAAQQRRRDKQAKGHALDLSVGVEPFVLGTTDSVEIQQRRGWLYNVLPTTVTLSNRDNIRTRGGAERAGLELFFFSEEGNFKTTLLYRPYFYLIPDLSRFQQHNSSSSQSQMEIALEVIRSALLRTYETSLFQVEVVYRMDLDQPNHLSPHQHRGRPVLKLVFDNVSQLVDVRDQVKLVVEQNQRRQNDTSHSATFGPNYDPQSKQQEDPLRRLVDLREYDVPYVVRVCTDCEVRAGTWYTVQLDPDLKETTGGVQLVEPDRESKANPTVLAFDIECTKAPLKFPSAEVDQIFMISYMVSTPTGASQGYLIVSRSVVSQDIDDFEYTPKPSYPGPFKIFNEPDEKALLDRFFAEFRRLAPQIVVTYNGDFFDWPFVDARAQHHGMDLFGQLGVEAIGEDGYRGRSTVHLDAFHWVQRDSYLPQGAQGLKAVTKYKLKYDPVEIDPEDMVRFAQERPVHMASYSVSDAVATYYLYEKYVHLFIFSLCTIIPMGPEDVLCKGSGTLCESLLMVQACQKSIICPNKQVEATTKFHNGHLLESETYIGGKVECLETGVYRSDIEYDFDLRPTAFQQLIENIDRDLTFAIEVEGQKKRGDIVNYQEVRSQIVEKLEQLRDRPVRTEKPYIYHLDVGAMYPNIILTNRLQPSAMVDNATCAACDFNREKNQCKRRMKWIWRGDYNPATRNEYEHIKNQLGKETIRDDLEFDELPKKEQASLIADRLKTYSRKAYKKVKVTEEEPREDIVCMRENDFYVGTVRQFRDRRYEFKRLNKSWKKKQAGAQDPAYKKQCADKVLVYDSLQIAHKCILNSFYGYVMRKGARWRSMEMAGIVTKTGADIITQARILVEQIGRPLELDTDGIWCILPGSFPDVYTFESSDGSNLKLEYPCVMLNADVHNTFTNDQYQTLVNPETGEYETKSDCSIFFEVDGPYKCMVIPASTEEGKLLKKRYAVFNHDGSLAELKGFELKRRGELELIKTFQSQVFERFLLGTTLKECYDSVAEIANHWIDVLDTRGQTLSDEELVDLISENRSMSRQLDDYGDQKGTSQTTAKRLGEFLGAEFIKDKGLSCKFIIAEQPYGAPVTERAIPTAIWKAEPSIMKHFLRKWLKSPGVDTEGLDIRNVLDWDYYMERLGNTIRKIITIPAALQRVSNPVPRVEHPQWLTAKVNRLQDKFKQQDISVLFKQSSKAIEKAPQANITVDIEDMAGQNVSPPKKAVVHQRKKRLSVVNKGDDSIEDEKRIPLSKTNFQDWLKQRKKVWRNEKRERKRAFREGIRAGARGERRPKTVSIENFVKTAALSLEQEVWHVIEIREMLGFEGSGTGDFIVWAMVGNDSLQKIVVSAPRTIYLSAHVEMTSVSDDFLEFRQVDKVLPQGVASEFLYSISMTEFVFRNRDWLANLRPVDKDVPVEKAMEKIYESGLPLKSRTLEDLGSLIRLKPSDQRTSKGKSYNLTDFERAEGRDEVEYLQNTVSYRRFFLYIRIHPRTRVGIVALHRIDGGSGSFAQNDDAEAMSTISDPTRPSESGIGGFDVGGECQVWIVNPGSKKQKNLSQKQCETVYRDLMKTISEEAGADSDYAFVSKESAVRFSGVKFVNTEEKALSAAGEALHSSARSASGASILLLNSSRSMASLRRCMPGCANMPVIELAFPPGQAHDPASSALPSLNWEQPACRLMLEAYLYMTVISFPKRVSYSRYGQVPVGNLGLDENIGVYETSLGRLLKRNRGVSWASAVAGRPNLGDELLLTLTGPKRSVDLDNAAVSQEDIWGEGELVSPVVRAPGCYRSICVDLDLLDLAISALTAPGNQSQPLPTGTKLSSPTSVAFLDGFSGAKNEPLGDEMTTAFSLSVLKSLASALVRDVFSSSSLVADELLHHIYRLVSNPETLFYDPALHRMVHSLMKSTFHKLLAELQRLGCSIVFASLQRITISTGKIELADAEEYVDFLIKTIQSNAMSLANSEDDSSLSRITLRPRQFHTHFIFLDEYNFGTLQLERVAEEDLSQEEAFVVKDEEGGVVMPSVVTAWSLMNHLGSERAQEYYQVLMGRFSMEPFKRQVEYASTLVSSNSRGTSFLDAKKTLVSKQFASFLTRAVGELLDDVGDTDMEVEGHDPRREAWKSALEFIKNIMVVLELDEDVENEVYSLKRSLLAQVGVAEYSSAAQWENPCPKYILSDVFCDECSSSRDVNLCFVPPGQEEGAELWTCEDCGAAYNAGRMERRIVLGLHRRIARYQLQDLRCQKTNRVAKRSLMQLSEASAPLKTDITLAEMEDEIRLLHDLARSHRLEILKDLTRDLLGSYQSAFQTS